MSGEFIFAVIVFGALIIGITIKMHFDELKGVDSEEKRKVAEIVRRVVPEGEEYTAAYAYWDRHMRHSIITWSYAIGFNSERIYVVPLSIVKDEMAYSDSFVIEKSRLGIVNSRRYKNKDSITWAEFYDEEQKHILSIWVRESNTKDSKSYPVNIQQKEETMKFGQLVNQWMDEVNTANGVTASGKISVGSFISSPIKKQKQ